MIETIGGLRIQNTKDIIQPDTKLAMLVWAASGKGKTAFAGGLNDLTMATGGLPTLYIGIEPGAGGGTATLRKKDNPLVLPKDLGQLDQILMALQTTKEFGGVVLDSATEMVKQFIKPVALTMPCREKGTGQAEVRQKGVPTRSDYQVMGEMARQRFQTLINMSSHPDPALRKHVIVTATDKLNEDEGRIVFWGPDLPGAMATTAAAMFQICATIDIKPVVVKGQRINTRVFVTAGDGVKALKDRFQVFPPEVPIKLLEGEDTVGYDLLRMWKEFWVPNMHGGER